VLCIGRRSAVAAHHERPALAETSGHFGRSPGERLGQRLDGGTALLPLRELVLLTGMSQ
jgi:hypothetical protein